MSDVTTVTVLPAPRRAKPRRKLGRWGVHSSGRFDRKLAAWIASLRRLMAYGVWITGTEAAGRSAADFRQLLRTDDTWAVAHLDGAAQGDGFALWDTTYVDLDGKPWARKLTNLTWVRSEEYGGGRAAKTHALVVPLRPTKGKARRTYLVVVHMPLDNTGIRAAAWVDCCRGLVALRADLLERDPDAEVIIVGDFNKNLRDPDDLRRVRQHLTTPLRMVTSWAKGLPKAGGTHGPRGVIDFAVLERALLAACELLDDDASSDHRPFRYRLRWVLLRLRRTS